MVLGGAWHGAGWTFIAWGSWHGLLLVLNRLWEMARARLGLRPLPAFIGIGITFLLVSFGWVFFRSPNLPIALEMFKGLGGYGQFLSASTPLHSSNPGPLNIVALQIYPKYSVAATWLIACALLVFFCPNSQSLTQGLCSADSKRARRIAILAAGLLGTTSISGASEFIYFNF
jgi:hypothetical protein